VLTILPRQVTAVEDFLRTKYTNTELYTWLESQTKNLYQQSYNLAYDLAKRAETAFQFERPQNANTEYIRMGYWTNARDGLLAGEQLFLGLKRLEAAYQGALLFFHCLIIIRVSKLLSLLQNAMPSFLFLSPILSCNHPSHYHPSQSLSFCTHPSHYY
jgi:hypothetical protein